MMLEILVLANKNLQIIFIETKFPAKGRWLNLSRHLKIWF